MNREEFLSKVRERGEYTDTVEALQASGAVLALLGQRLAEGEAEHLAAQLPQGIADAVRADGSRETFGKQEFLRRVGAQLGATEETAQWDASAVLTTVAEAVSGGQLNQVLSQLPSGYAELFGKPELA